MTDNPKTISWEFPRCPHQFDGWCVVCVREIADQARKEGSSEIEGLKAENEAWRIKADVCLTVHLPKLVKLEEIMSERDALLQTLAKERDDFGKRETELIKERNALKAELDRAKSSWHTQNVCQCDRWRGIAEKMSQWLEIEHMENVEGLIIHKKDNPDCPICKSLSLFDEAVEPPKHGPGTGCKCTACETWEA